jgi:hypothetical protein
VDDSSHGLTGPNSDIDEALERVCFVATPPQNDNGKWGHESSNNDEAPCGLSLSLWCRELGEIENEGSRVNYAENGGDCF